MTDTDDRAALTAALRELADFIDTHPDLPVPDLPSGATVQIFPCGSDDEARVEVDRIAAILGRTAETTEWQRHHRVERSFGGRVTYRAVAIPQDAMDAHRAEQSYVGAVQPA